MREKINEFLKLNYKKLVAPEYYFGVDNNQDTIEDFENAKFRILVAFLSTGSTRSVSNTFNAISHQAKLGNEGVFIDYCYFPEEDNIDKFKSAGLPTLFGNVSHAPAQEYDLIMLSHSIVPEVINIPRLLKGANLPLTVEQRMEDTTIPLIMYGGAAANESSLTLGPIFKDGECIGHSMIDIATYGYAEGVMHKYVAKMMEFKEQGMDPKEDKRAFVNKLIDEKVCYGKMFFSEFYEWVYEEDRFTIKEIRCLDERLPKEVDYNRITNEVLDNLGWMNKVFNLDGDNSSSVDMQVSSGCSGAESCCSFCMEATVAGGYHELEYNKMVDKMRWMKRNCAPNSSSMFSYNVNYYYRFMDIIAKQASMFSGISLLNERMDVIANAPEQMKLAKAVGLKRVSSAIEGAGVRIRNGILNKNLDRATLMKATENIMELKLMMMKMGMIRTGQETEADYDEFLSELEEMINIRNAKGANTSFQINWTPLVFYSQIALRHLPRITAEESYSEARNMGYFLDKLKELKERYNVPIRNKVNGKGPGTYIEQLLLDFGPAGTDWLVGCVEDGLTYGRHFNKKDKEVVLKNLDERNYQHLFFTQGRPKDWIFPNDHINYATQIVKDRWWERTEKMNFDTKLCLKTLANLESKCHGCKMCEPKHIINMTKRQLDTTSKLEDVINVLNNARSVDATRVVFQVAEEYQFISKKMLAHYITSKFLQVGDDSLVDKFFKVGKLTTHSVAKDGQKDWFSGTFCYDIEWKENIRYGELNDLIDKVNASLKSCRVKAIYYNVADQRTTTNQTFSFIGTLSNFSMSKLKDKFIDFNWEVKVATKAMGTDMTLVKKLMPELKDMCLFIPYKDKILFSMCLPAGVNPHLVLSSMLGKNYQFCLENTSIQVVGHSQPVDLVCKCGNHLEYNFFTDKVDKMCPVCQSKIRLKMISSK